MDWDKNDYNGEGLAKIHIQCHICGINHEIAVEYEDFKRWDWGDGGLVKDIFPYLSADKRELLISSTCGKCFDSLFGDNDEEDEG